MDRTFGAGLVLATLGTAGYLLGTQVAYPGRAFAVTGVMVGITLLAVGSGGERP